MNRIYAQRSWNYRRNTVFLLDVFGIGINTTQLYVNRQFENIAEAATVKYPKKNIILHNFLVISNCRYKITK